jgi:uncharacterized protein YdcH (DUF465 family)
MSNWKNHIAALQKRHAELDKKIDNMEKTGLYGDTLLHEMKKERLHLRDEIVILEQQHKNESSL